MTHHPKPYQPWCHWCGRTRDAPCLGTLANQMDTQRQKLLVTRARYLAELDFSYAFVRDGFDQIERELDFLNEIEADPVPLSEGTRDHVWLRMHAHPIGLIVSLLQRDSLLLPTASTHRDEAVQQYYLQYVQSRGSRWVTTN